MAEAASSTPSQPELMLKRIHLSLRELIEVAEIARARAAKLQNLHPTDMACLAYLQRVGSPVSAKQITSHLNLSSGSGTALLDRLESAGYTRRLPNPDDLLCVLIELDVEMAKEPLARMAEIERGYAAMTQSFSENDLAAIAKFLDEMNRIAKRLAE